MANLLTQSLKLLKDATVSYGKDYMSNSMSLVNDANEIRTEVMKTAKTNIETLRGLKRNINFKAVRDWFYQKEQDAELADGEDFDPGFDTGELRHVHLVRKKWIVSVIAKLEQCIKSLHVKMKRCLHPLRRLLQL